MAVKDPHDEHQHIVVHLNIKGTPETALIKAREKLNTILCEWFAEDQGGQPPYPEGSLLTWNITFPKS